MNIDLSLVSDLQSQIKYQQKTRERKTGANRFIYLDTRTTKSHLSS